MYFSRKIQNDDSQNLTFNGCNVISTSSKNHLGFVLDEKLNFDKHIRSKISKCNKRISTIDRLSLAFPRDALSIIYRSFIRLHLDCANIIYDRPNNDSFSQKMFKIEHVWQQLGLLKQNPAINFIKDYKSSTKYFVKN